MRHNALSKASYEKPVVEITRFETRDIVFAYATATPKPTATSNPTATPSPYNPPYDACPECLAKQCQSGDNCICVESSCACYWEK